MCTCPGLLGVGFSGVWGRLCVGVALLMSLLAGVRARRALPTSGPCRAAHFAEGPEIASQSRRAAPIGCYTMVAGGARVGLHNM